MRLYGLVAGGLLIVSGLVAALAFDSADVAPSFCSAENITDGMAAMQLLDDERRALVWLEANGRGDPSQLLPAAREYQRAEALLARLLQLCVSKQAET